MKQKVSELEGIQLDIAAAKAEGIAVVASSSGKSLWLVPEPEPEDVALLMPTQWSPSTYWDQGGPIIERERIMLWPLDAHGETGWDAGLDPNINNDFNVICGEDETPTTRGLTALTAAMRCYVASKFGEEIELP